MSGRGEIDLPCGHFASDEGAMWIEKVWEEKDNNEDGGMIRKKRKPG